MNPISTTIRSADWKTEKHAPIIHAPDAAKANECIPVEALVGQAIPHPNTPHHHIAWIALYFQPDHAPFPIELARATFPAHGAAPDNTPPPASTKPLLSTHITLTQSGTLQALAYCNLHGLWQSEKIIAIS